MASREELYQALRNADAAGDVEGARKLAAFIQTMPDDAPKTKAKAPTAYAFAPDSWRGKAMSAIDAAEGLPYVGGVVKGALNLSKGGAELMAHGLNAISPSIVSDEELRNVDRNMQVNAQKYESARLRNNDGKKPGVDLGSVAGEVAVTWPLMTAKAASVPIMALKNGLLGGSLGMLTPVADGGENFGTKKAIQTGTGATIGAAAPFVLDPIIKTGAKVVNAAASKAGATFDRLTGNLQNNATATINLALKQSGIDINALPPAVRADLLQEAQAALKAGGTLDAAALRRKADFLGIGAKPTLGAITRDPTQFTREQTLKGVQGAGEELADTISGNNHIFIDRLNQAGAENAPEAIKTGDAVIGTLSNFAKQREQEIARLYGIAKNSEGRPAQLDAQHFTAKANELLKHNLKTRFLPKEFKELLDDIAEGREVLDVETAEQIKTMLATSQRTANDGNKVAAMGFVRDALEDTPVVGQLGQEALDAFNLARSTTREFKQLQEAVPALRDTINGKAPDQFFQKHVLNAPVRDVDSMLGIVAADPTAREAIKQQVVAHFKNRALGGASDEVGVFSQSGFNKAMKQFGDEKLKLLFSPEEIAQMKMVGRASSYMQAAPAGNSVNRSNTSGQLFNLLMKGAERMPAGKTFITDPINTAISGSGVKRAVGANVPRLPNQNPMITDAMQHELVGLLSPLGVTAGTAGLLN